MADSPRFWLDPGEAVLDTIRGPEKDADVGRPVAVNDNTKLHMQSEGGQSWLALPIKLQLVIMHEANRVPYVACGFEFIAMAGTSHRM